MSAPFGITLYSPIETLSVVQDLGHGSYLIEAPSPHPMFDAYLVRATPALGVVWVKGLGRRHRERQFRDRYPHPNRPAHRAARTKVRPLRKVRLPDERLNLD